MKRRRLHEPTTVNPRDNWGPEEWAERIRELQAKVNETRGKAVEMLIEYGRGLRAAHNAFKASPQRWGEVRWEKWAEDLRCPQPTMSMLETIAKVFGEEYSHCEYYSSLPTSWSTLYHLALAARADRAAFEAALESGRISPEMTRAEAKELAQEIRVQHEQAQREQARQQEQQDKTEEPQQRERAERQRESGGSGARGNGATGGRSEEADTPRKKLQRIAKLLGKLGSDADTEVLKAGRDADNLRRAMGFNWSDILRLPAPRRKQRRARASARKPH